LGTWQKYQEPKQLEDKIVSHIETEDLITGWFYKCKTYEGHTLELEYQGNSMFWNHNPDGHYGHVMYLILDVQYVLERV